MGEAVWITMQGGTGDAMGEAVADEGDMPWECTGTWAHLVKRRPYHCIPPDALGHAFRSSVVG